MKSMPVDAVRIPTGLSRNPKSYKLTNVIEVVGNRIIAKCLEASLVRQRERCLDTLGSKREHQIVEFVPVRGRERVGPPVMSLTATHFENRSVDLTEVAYAGRERHVVAVQRVVPNVLRKILEHHGELKLCGVEEV